MSIPPSPGKKTDYKDMLCNLFLSFYILCSLPPGVPAGLLEPIRAGCVGCLIAGLVGSLVLRAVLAVYVLSVTVLAAYVLSACALASVLSIAILIAVSAIRRVVLCIRVLCHLFLHSGSMKTPAALLYLLTAGLVFEIRQKLYTKNFLSGISLFIAFLYQMFYTMSVICIYISFYTPY